MTSPSEKSTEARSDRPIFDFFSVPPSVSTVPSLASSIQSLETCFFLLALDRYPHALTACVSAIESCIKASPSCQRENELWRLIKAAIKQSGRLSQFPEADLDDLRKTRNRIVHEGFIPKDDSHSVFLLLNVGFPFTLQCFSELHRLGLMRYMNSQYGKQINISNAVFRRVKRFQETNDLTEFEFTYCLRNFSHLVNWEHRRSILLNWEMEALMQPNQSEYEYREVSKGKLESIFGTECSFDCPICGGWQSVVCELDGDRLNFRRVVPKRMACVECGFVVGKKEPFMSRALLGRKIPEARDSILKDYGLL